VGLSGDLRRWLGRRRVWLVLGIAALFSGVALLGYLLAGLALPLTLAFTGTLLVVTVIFIWRRSDSATRGLMKSVVVRGALVMSDRVELQAELDAPRTAVFELMASTDGLRRWLDEAELEARVGGHVRVRMHEAPPRARCCRTAAAAHQLHLGLGGGAARAARAWSPSTPSTTARERT
jgi:hypothetical protein